MSIDIHKPQFARILSPVVEEIIEVPHLRVHRKPDRYGRVYSTSHFQRYSPAALLVQPCGNWSTEGSSQPPLSAQVCTPQSVPSEAAVPVGGHSELVHDDDVLPLPFFPAMAALSVASAADDTLSCPFSVDENQTPSLPFSFDTTTPVSAAAWEHRTPQTPLPTERSQQTPPQSVPLRRGSSRATDSPPDWSGVSPHDRSQRTPPKSDRCTAPFVSLHRLGRPLQTAEGRRCTQPSLSLHATGCRKELLVTIGSPRMQ